MPLYQYLAVDNNGKKHKGTQSAESETLLRKKLRNDALIPIDLSVISKPLIKKTQQNAIDRTIKSGFLALFTRELSALINAGLEIEQSLLSVAAQSSDLHLKPILQAIHIRILEGQSLAASINEFPKAFSKVYRSTIKAGEDSGYLGLVLENLAEFLDKQQEMRQKVIHAIIYPTILILISLGIVTFLLTYVTPKIISIFEESTESLPFATKILLSLSYFFQHFGVITLILFVGLYFLGKRLLKIETVKAKFHRFLLRLPYIGSLIQTIETARFLRTLAILTRANVPILQSILVASELVVSIPIRREILMAKDKIKEGGSIHFALKNTRFFNASSLQFIASGETSGKLEEMLKRSSENQERHVQFALTALLTIFEPLLIIVMGAIVLFIVLATLLPIFQLSSMVG